ncbi:hypothetical protein MNEG_9360 [Monoraphidium neglectum]|uniref:Leucine-rich repeat domain-containing protein n=1 Tax=Monoraphidium neglectum TaxID=145388 RepID=A0A0D2M549_9CHLO|nr:hypothetical protein MNEG_9360 [Monoraphidium neglectum]KIY98604.1 hypothetical protein MNEG_9360 [Monoraphidium neglectum]|eukprot:XP_013897624.1 hypothetical protein MNEG_9360 [Monoraphidium neglectum]
MTPEVLEERLAEARQSYKLNVGYAGLAQLPSGFAELVKKHNPHILELELSSNNLTAVPDELSEFAHLRTLRLKYNQLRKLPPVVAQLPALTVLELAGNQIGKLDPGIISAMVCLRELDLSGNQLLELPAAICRLPKLEALLESLPEEIGELPALVRLNVSTNALRTLPTSMGRLRKIQRIDAANNMLVRVPPSMGHLKTIKELNLRYNNLDERYKSKIEEGLSRLLSFLREEAERERLEEIERLKPIGTQLGPYTAYRHGHVTVYDPEHHQLVVFGGRTAERKRLDDV